MKLTSARSSPQFKQKPADLQQQINEALEILDAFGLPIDGLTPRQAEKTAMALLAVADVRPGVPWAQTKDASDGRRMKTRDIIGYHNEHFGEDISLGSYDDIRRKDLRNQVLAGVVVSTDPDSARNSPNRAYALSPEFADAVRAFGSPQWKPRLDAVMQGRQTLRTALAAERKLARQEIVLPSGVQLDFGPGDHNALIKATIEEFLPRYGAGAEVLYVGDAEDKNLHVDRDRLKALRFFDLGHGELPDVVAYAAEKNWLYLVECVHTSGPISAARQYRLRSLLTDCTALPIYVTAFADRAVFRRFVGDIAWETEVWIASEPDHLVHFDGEKFLGPYAAP